MVNIQMVKNDRDLGYDFIRFFAMMLIVIHHIYTTCQEFKYPMPSEFINLVAHGVLGFGGTGVALFFMLSGAILMKKYENNLNYKEFYIKRLLRIEIPQMIGFFCAFWCQYLIWPSILTTTFEGILVSFLGLGYAEEFWAQFGIHSIWVIGEWFTAVIIILYILFPLSRKLFIANKFTGGGVALLFILNLKYQIFSYVGGWFSITNGLMCFWMGMYFEKYKHLLNKRIVVYLCAIAALIFWIVNPLQVFGYAYLSCFIFSMLLFIIIYQVKITNKFTSFICKYNYEIYLIHHRVFILFFPALLTARSNSYQLIISAILLTGITFLLAIALSKASNIVVNRCVKRRTI